MARGSIPYENGVKKKLASHPSQGTVNSGAVSKWDVKHNQPTNHILRYYLNH